MVTQTMRESSGEMVEVCESVDAIVNGDWMLDLMLYWKRDRLKPN